MVTSLSTGVAFGSVVSRSALYFRYRIPLNCASESPLEKNEVAVPSGPTKVNGPVELLLAAAWNLTLEPAGADAVHPIESQVGVAPAAGFASFRDDVNLRAGAYVSR